MPADLSRSWGLLFVPTNLQKSTVSEERQIHLICSSPATPFGAIACHPSKLHSLTHYCLTVTWDHRKQKHPWGIKRNYEVKSKKTWKGMFPLNFTPLFCFIPLYYNVLCLQEKYVSPALFQSLLHYNNSLIYCMIHSVLSFWSTY